MQCDKATCNDETVETYALLAADGKKQILNFCATHRVEFEGAIPHLRDVGFQVFTETSLDEKKAPPSAIFTEEMISRQNGIGPGLDGRRP